MKNIIKQKMVLLLASAVLLVSSCSKDFITIQPQGDFLTQNYYANEAQAYAGLTAVYDVLRKNAGGFDNMITFLNAGSDDHFAGGGGPTDGAGIQGFSNYTLNPNIIPGSFWSDHFQGIFRANTLLIKLPDVPMEEIVRQRFTAETKALRAIYYFNLVRMFRNVPLLLEPLTTANIYEVTQAAPADVYAQIETDLLEAIPNLPSTVAGMDMGRITKGAAQAMLGKAYLYQDKKAEAATQLAQVNGTTPGQPNQYGNQLLGNFADLWVFSNKYNAETILACQHTDKSNADWGFWGSGGDEGNSVNQMVGPRSYEKIGANAPDIPSGWSFNVFTQGFYNLIQGDPRFAATVLDMKDLADNDEAKYVEGYQNTGYFLNKFIPRTSDMRTGGGSLELNYKQNDYIIRLADTYLLEAEALNGTGARAQALLDAVRARVGLGSVPVSLAAIKAERRLELAGEGHRFFDLVRWGDAPTALGSRGFQAGKSEIFPIPARELQGTKLIQNPNY